MIRSVLILVLLAVALDAHAQSGSGQAPYWSYKAQGLTGTSSQVSVTTASKVLVESDGATRAWSIAIETGTLYVCCDDTYGGVFTTSPTPTPSACTTATAGIVLSDVSGRTSYTNETSAKARCRAITTSGTVTVFLQRWK